MVPPVDEDLSCKQIGPDVIHNVKLYVSVQIETKAVNIYSRVSSTKYNKTSYVFDGPQAKKFLTMADESLLCVRQFKDIHD